jgi:hypothetical protein
VQEAEWAQQPVWMGPEKLAPYRYSIPRPSSLQRKYLFSYVVPK